VRRLTDLRGLNQAIYRPRATEVDAHDGQ
jgi:hypothetical protein